MIPCRRCKIKGNRKTYNENTTGRILAYDKSQAPSVLFVKRGDLQASQRCGSHTSTCQRLSAGCVRKDKRESACYESSLLG